MRESTCSFCGKAYEIGTGIQIAKNDGNIIYFCSSKCRKNFNLGRSAIHTRWTQRFRDFKAEAAGGKKKKATVIEKIAKTAEAVKKKIKPKKKLSARKERKRLARKKK